MTERNGLPEGWTKAKLQDIAVIRDDLRLPVNADERSRRAGPYPYYGATGQVGWIDNYRMDGEYVLLGEDGAPFLDPVKPKAYLVSGKSWVNNHAHVLHSIEGLTNNRFLMYSLNAADYRGYVNGTTRLKLTQAAMRNILVALPPVTEQRRIVAAIEEQFTRLDAGVAGLERVRANLRRYRASVLKAAVEGKLTEEWRVEHPDVEPAITMLRRVLGFTPDSAGVGVYLTSTDQSNVPDTWTETALEIVAAAIDPHPSHRTPPELEGGVPYIGIGDVSRQGHLDTARARKVPQAILAEHRSRYRLRHGDFIFGKIGTLGRPAKLPEPFDYALSANVVLIQPMSEVMTPLFAYFYMAGPAMELLLIRGSRATTQAAFGITRIRKLPFPVPPMAEQDEIVSEVERRLSVIERIEAQVEADLKRAARLRQSILKRAFEGKLVSQEPTDEPASVLLERIRVQREKVPSRPPSRARQNGKRAEYATTPLFTVEE